MAGLFLQSTPLTIVVVSAKRGEGRRKNSVVCRSTAALASPPLDYLHKYAFAAKNGLAAQNGLDVATNTANLRTRKNHLLASWYWSRIAVLSSSCSQIISHMWKGIHGCIEMKFTYFSLLRRLLCWEQLGARGTVNLSFRIRSQPAVAFHHQQPAPWVRALLNPTTLEIPSLSCKAPLLRQALHWSPQLRSSRP